MSRLKCSDCGQPLPAKLERSKRADVCDLCWDTRLSIVRGEIALSDDEILSVQRKMAAGRGTAATFIKQLEADHAD